MCGASRSAAATTGRRSTPILDEALVCHLGFVHDGHPYVIPTLFARIGDEVFVHGSAASRMLRTLAGGVGRLPDRDARRRARPRPLGVQPLRQLPLGGRARPGRAGRGQGAALRAFTERLLPGRWDEARQPTAKELKATTILRLPLDEASAKLREGPPKDDEDDYAWPVWAGVIPLASRWGEPVPDPRLGSGFAAPESPNGQNGQ